ncbi:MAG: hypothetical protein OEO77_13895, partial [Acidimicrobiia bacterium]|nr:hypothetical protein [Acidimicrobiia bacterium]
TPVPDCGRCPVVAGSSDPGVYLAPPRQGPFTGSPRQARGAVLRALLEDRSDATALMESTGLDENRVVRALGVLHSEGTIVRTGDGLWAVDGAD